jgi:nucleotide-binding universal stress UspA family protein
VQGFRNVLVPLDFSDNSERVIETALRILHPEGRAMLLHVVEWMPVMTEGTLGVYTHRRDIDSMRKLAKDKLLEHLKEHPDAPFDIEVHEGRPAAVILDLAAARKPEVIVIGIHGRSALDHFLIGSTTEKVLRKAHCHVLAVRK